MPILALLAGLFLIHSFQNESRAREVAEVDAEHAAHTHVHHLPDDDETPEMAEKNHIGFAQRAYPFLEMLRAARDGGDSVMWGV